ncbi:hypothetical protein SBD_8150 [Streptomyces bottropensis ATCC 25435]|uniref:Uncharacterized protein n=1 Tax=Streptomyces bottropensis ATCC 25435 TaxID=1054862 RepID=M3FCP2_9ACTN|nr:hypothetical protein SBD_8150 [Streptomyces bottropensis ATCC 25435]
MVIVPLSWRVPVRGPVRVRGARTPAHYAGSRNFFPPGPPAGSR